MKDMHITSPKGMNDTKKVTKGAKDRGQVTDGVDLKKGYKVVNPPGSSPKARSVINKSEN